MKIIFKLGDIIPINGTNEVELSYERILRSKKYVYFSLTAVEKLTMKLRVKVKRTCTTCTNMTRREVNSKLQPTATPALPIYQY